MFAGEVEVGAPRTPVRDGQLGVLTEGGAATFSVADDAASAEMLLFAGAPIGEPVVRHGPFVMNAPHEIEQAIIDFRRTGFGGWPWESDGPVHPREQGRFAIHAGVAVGWLAPTPGTTLDTLARTATATGGGSGATFLSILFGLNLILLVFNLLPLPPLDGSGALPLVMSDQLAQRYRALLRHPAISLAGILLAWRLFWPIFQPVLTACLRLVYPGI